MSLPRARLGVNIDHVATIRNARGGMHPEPAKAAAIAEAAGADGITIHLREDRRHIRDADLAAVRAATKLPINLEMATTDEMLANALAFGPHAACLVPERREERTTEGGLDVARLHNQVAPFVKKLRDANIRVSLFIEPAHEQILMAEAMGAPVVELHTGKYVELVFAGHKAEADAELKRLNDAAELGASKGIEIHVGHGLTYETVRPVAAIPQVKELNIGHFIMGEALFVGLDVAVRRMRAEIDAARGVGMSSKQYEQMLRDTVHLLIEKTRDPSIYGGGDYQRGYVQAMYTTLSLIRSQIDLFDIDASRVGMGDFDPAEWRELGALYWDMRSGGRQK